MSTYNKAHTISFDNLNFILIETCHHFYKFPKIVGSRHRDDLVQTVDKKNLDKTLAVRFHHYLISVLKFHELYDRMLTLLMEVVLPLRGKFPSIVGTQCKQYFQ